MTIWIKESGKTIELNDEDATIDKALELGWKTEELMEDETDDEDE